MSIRKKKHGFSGKLVSLGTAFLASLLAACVYEPAAPKKIPGPEGVELTLFYDTAEMHLDLPVWFGEVPGEQGAFAVGDLGGRIHLLRVDSGGTTSSIFAELPVALAAYNDGFLGMAFHPDFQINRKYYVYYNSKVGEVLLAERTALPGSLQDAGTERELIRLPTLPYPHNGGDLHFGPDGYLYLGIGDGASATEFHLAQDSLHADAQSLSVLYGKMIRIDVDQYDSGKAYAIPSDNPFVGQGDSVRGEIWAYGLRNPWRWSFDPLDARIFVGDVGLVHREEINIVEKGENYGWRRLEGSDACFNDESFWFPLARCDKSRYTLPIAEIRRSPPYPSQAVIGGYVFRGDTASPYYGAYIFGEAVTGAIYLLPVSEQDGTSGRYVEIARAAPPLAGFGTDSKGNIYAVEYGGETIRRIDHPDLTGKLNPAE